MCSSRVAHVLNGTRGEEASHHAGFGFTSISLCYAIGSGKKTRLCKTPRSRPKLAERRRDAVAGFVVLLKQNTTTLCFSTASLLHPSLLQSFKQYTRYRSVCLVSCCVLLQRSTSTSTSRQSTCLRQLKRRPRRRFNRQQPQHLVTTSFLYLSITLQWRLNQNPRHTPKSPSTPSEPSLSSPLLSCPAS